MTDRVPPYKPRFVSVRTFAQESGFTERQIRGWIARGLIPHRKLGSRVLLLRDDIDSWLNQLPGSQRRDRIGKLPPEVFG